MGPTACGIGSIYGSAMLEQLVIYFQRSRQVAPHCLTVVVYDGSRYTEMSAIALFADVSASVTDLMVSYCPPLVAPIGTGATTGGNGGGGPDPQKIGWTTPTFLMKSVITVT